MQSTKKSVLTLSLAMMAILSITAMSIGVDRATSDRGSIDHPEPELIANETMMLPDGVIVVDDDADPGGEGSSWEDAFNLLHVALAWADTHSVDEIWVAEGSYSPGNDPEDTFELIPGVKLRGGFVGGESGETTVAQMKARDVYAHPTYLGGGDDVYHVVTFTDYNDYPNPVDPEDTLIDGFHIDDGAATGTYFDADGEGGGMYVRDAEVYILRCTFAGNAAITFGAGLYIEGTDSDVVVCNCRFLQNECSGGGGGLANNGGAVRLFNSLFWLNSAGDGAGIFNNEQGTQETPHLILDVKNCTITKNDATSAFGGGILNEAMMHVTNCIVYGNTDSYSTTQTGREETEIAWFHVSGSYTVVTSVYNTTIGADALDDWAGNDNSIEEPEFVNWSANNYHLMETSPCLDSGTGVTASNYNDDFDIDDDSNTSELTPALSAYMDPGPDRIVACAIDRGAFEFFSPCNAADLNSDCKVNVLDLLNLLGAWGPNPSHPADLNDDDTVNVTDLYILLGEWGACACATTCVLSLETEMENSGLTWPEDWWEFEALFEAYPVDEDAIENYVFWLHHYLSCHNNQTCPGVMGEPGRDPFGGH